MTAVIPNPWSEINVQLLYSLRGKHDLLYESPLYKVSLRILTWQKEILSAQHFDFNVMYLVFLVFSVLITFISNYENLPIFTGPEADLMQCFWSCT